MCEEREVKEHYKLSPFSPSLPSAIRSLLFPLCCPLFCLLSYLYRSFVYFFSPQPFPVSASYTLLFPYFFLLCLVSLPLLAPCYLILSYLLVLFTPFRLLPLYSSLLAFFPLHFFPSTVHPVLLKVTISPSASSDFQI